MEKKGVSDQKNFAILTNEISRGTFNISIKKHKEIKKLDKKQILRDHMSPIELVLTTLAEATTAELHRTNDSQGMNELKNDAGRGGSIASITRRNIEKELGKPVVTCENAIDFKNKNKIEVK